MIEIAIDRKQVAYCGLYCAACKSLRKGRCPGCHQNAKANWCKVRACGIEHGYASCADCKDFGDPGRCAKFNNLISKVFGLVFNSNRRACVLKIRELGLDHYASFMAERGLQSLPRRAKDKG
jgi:hypothetical protein